MEPLISVIVPAYNIEEYLERSINSILNQTYLHIEIIIVNDGSSDRTGEIADYLREKNPTKIQCVHQSNSGVTAARLNGVQAAHGDWIGFVDGDDEIENNMYERLLTNALETEADISHCGYQTIVNGGERIHYFYNSGKKIVNTNLQGKKELLTGTQVEPSLCNKLYKHRLISRMIEEEVLDLSVKFNEDLLMNYILFDYAEKSVYEDFCPYHYMTRSDSASRSNFSIKRVLDPVLVKKWILENCDDEHKELAWRKYLVCCCNAYQYIWNKTSYKTEASRIKRIVLKNFSKIRLLTLKEKIKLYMVFFTPGIFNACYCFYAKFFQKKVYE